MRFFYFRICPKPARAQYICEGPPRDSVIRLLYVGGARARKRLHLCQAETSLAVHI
jgi:hypothetical protein